MVEEQQKFNEALQQSFDRLNQSVGDKQLPQIVSTIEVRTNRTSTGS